MNGYTGRCDTCSEALPDGQTDCGDHAPAARNEPPPKRKLPLTRAGCIDGPRPCPHATCRHHLDGPESCSLDVADRGGATREEIGALFGVSRTLIARVETRALQRLCARLGVPMPAREDYEPEAVVHNDHMFARRDANDHRIFAALVAVERGTVKQIAAAAAASHQLTNTTLVRLIGSGRAVRTRQPGHPPAYIYEPVLGEAAE